jgi:LDH2 family malate/lactate/ureidoglycolate dehydrogenase
LIPGDPEREMESIRKKEGIPITESVVEDLKNTGSIFDIVGL